MRVTVGVVVTSLFLALLFSAPAHAQQPDPQLAQDLNRLSIEELTQLDITTASRRVEPLVRLSRRVERRLARRLAAPGGFWKVTLRS